MVIFQKNYDDESLYDMPEDLGYAVDEENPDYHKLPEDEHGLKKGTFTVTITWENN
jgi:hypothetical protein